MATTRGISGITESTTTTGTGSYVLAGAVSPWAALGAGDDGKTFHYGVYQSGGGFETGIGVYTHATRTVTRANVLTNHLRTTSPIDWGAGTKEWSIVMPPERAAMIDYENEFTADQALSGNKLKLDADDDSWIVASTDDVVQTYVNSVEKLKLTGALSTLTLYGDDDGAGEGPEIVAVRRSNSPAINDVGPLFRLKMKDLGGNEVTVGKIRATATAVTDGAASSKLTFDILKAGSLQSPLELRNDLVYIPSGISLHTGGKTSQSNTTAGLTVGDDGEVSAVGASGITPLIVARNGSAGDLVEFFKDNVSIGDIAESGGTVTYNAFTGGHYSDWHGSVDPIEIEGTVLATAEGLLEWSSDQLPLVKPATKEDARRLYGVFVSRRPTRGRMLIQLWGLGLGRIRCTGPIAAGDLLTISAIPGVAEAQADDFVRSSTIAKATQHSPDDGSVRLVPCVLMAG